MGINTNIAISEDNPCQVCNTTHGGWTYICDICGIKGCSLVCGYWFNKCKVCSKIICGGCSTNLGLRRVCKLCLKNEPKFLRDWVEDDKI